MSRLSCLLLLSQALVAFSAPTFQLAPRGLSVLPLGNGNAPEVITLRENVARRENAARHVTPRNRIEDTIAAILEGGLAKAGKKTEKKAGKKAAKKAKQAAEKADGEAAVVVAPEAGNATEAVSWFRRLTCGLCH